MTARCLTAALLLAGSVAPASAQISTNPKVLAPFKTVVAAAKDSTVRVRCDDKDAALGTVVASDGLILTKASELKGAVTVRLPDGTEYEAAVLGVHLKTDLALLKVDVKDLKPIKFTDSKKAVMGNWLASPGPTSDPLGVGIVSVKTRPLTDRDAVMHKNRGYLGIIPTDEKGEDGKVIGAKIQSVSEDGAAVKAGLKKDDVILKIDGASITGESSLRSHLENLRPGDTVSLKVKRGAEEKSFKVTLTGYLGPKDRGEFQNSMGSELSQRRTGFPSVLQTDMVVEPKNCGGPVVDLDGNVLGINIARAGRVETWILPSELINPLLVDLKAGKFAPTEKELKELKEGKFGR